MPVFKIMVGVECVAVFTKVTRCLRLYGIRANNHFLGFAVGGEQIEVPVEKLTRALSTEKKD